jgi:murein DD-endopeptidase MepM/ murein hydrolase activator NlpD
MTLSKRLASVLLAMALVASMAAPADAAPSTAASRQKQREIKAARAKKAAQLDALKASDDALEKAVEVLGKQVTSQGARVAAAKQAVAATELQTAVRNRAVDAYIRPQQAALAGLVEAKNLEDVSRRASMLKQVTNNDSETIDRLHAAREDLAIEREQASSARSVAGKRREAAKQQLDTLEVNLKDKAKADRDLKARIAEITGEAEALAAQDTSITELIRQGELRRASRGDTGTVSGSGMRWPVSGPVTSGFGYRWGRLHAGIDIGAGTGTPIHAAKSGTVIFAGTQGGYGNCVIIDHGGGLSTLYGHMSRIGARDGEDVNGGDVIGYVGSTGHSTGPHLHFETRVGGSPQNPRRYL